MTDTAFGKGTFVGRVWRPDLGGPSLVTIRDGALFDITSKATPTMRDLLELPDPVAHVRSVAGERLASLEECLARKADASTLHLIAPSDLQAVKACGVTFARSMIERVIEERAAGDASRAEAIRSRVTAVIGDSLRNLKPGSAEAARVKAALQEEGVWSQYLEVGIGPDAEVFTKAQVLSAVGPGAAVGLHPAFSSAPGIWPPLGERLFQKRIWFQCWPALLKTGASSALPWLRRMISSSDRPASDASFSTKPFSAVT